MLCIDTDAQRARNRRGERNDTIRVDSLGTDTIALDTLGGKKKKEPLDAPVIYEASDSIVFTEGGFANLYGHSKVNYEKIEQILQKLDKVKDEYRIIEEAPLFDRRKYFSYN